MSRQKIASKLIQFLEEKINCKNVMKKADDYSTEAEKILLIESENVVFEIYYYDDTKIEEGDRNQMWVQRLIQTLDFMVESNHMGFEYFPYVYGLLNCHEGPESKIYLYTEAFDGRLEDLFGNILHPSDWYDVIFQIVMIDYWIRLHKYEYDASIEKFVFRKYPKPFKKKYEIDSLTLNLSRKYLIIYANTQPFISLETIVTNFPDEILEPTGEDAEFPIKKPGINMLYSFVIEGKFPVPPSHRIVRMLEDLMQNKDIEGTNSIINKYYGNT